MKKKKVLIIVAVLAIVLVVAVLVWYLIWGKNKSVNNQETAVKIETSAGREVVFAQLTSVKGNEITYIVAEEAGEASSVEMPEGFENGEMPARPEDFENGEMPARPEGFENGEMPARPGGFEGGGFQTMPDVSGNGEKPAMPEGGEMSDRPQMPGGGMNRDFSYDGNNYQLTEESRTELIPVGTDVITKLGTVTTFSRLAAGDNIALIVENEGEEPVIVAVYIIG